MLNGKRILIANTPGLGDLIMLTPSLRVLKAMYPRCVLSVVSYEKNLPVVERLPYVDKTYGIVKGKFLGRFRPAVHFGSQDYVIFTTWQPQLAVLAWLLGVPYRAGVYKEMSIRGGSGSFHVVLRQVHGMRKTAYFKQMF